MVGPGDAIVRPPQSTRTDFEGELAVVIGRIAKNVPAASALDYVFGYTLGNDVTARDLQNSDHGHREENRLPRPVGIVTNDLAHPPEEDGCQRDVQRVLHGYPGIDGRESVPEGEEGKSADDQRIEFDLRFFIPATPKGKQCDGKYQQPEEPKSYREKLPGINGRNQEEK